MDDEADDDLVILEMIEERAAAGAATSGQPKVCCTRPGLVLVRVDLPQLLQADAVLLRLGGHVELEHARSVLCQ